jgi:HD superfamily phosphohydrolase
MVTAMAQETGNLHASSNDRSRVQELFLPVHGHVMLYPDEVAIIDHPSFQRLRRVRQLGFAHIVFPGGVHTRLEHSIGAVHVAQVIINHVNENADRSL